MTKLEEAKVILKAFGFGQLPRAQVHEIFLHPPS